ncbi:MAG: hypothetical protein AUK37_08450 [Rhodobacterales bacterium CG2_30_65_12]|nr:MAG: hypothetical protein AUK37_08450 [Rhodobacterales bacterium CG2_30_65_12]
MHMIATTARLAREAKRSAPALALALALATPVGAADLPLPEGCEAFLTVQSRGCSVSVLWRCDVTPKGDFTEASFGADGLEALVSYSASYQWLDSLYVWDSSREEFLPPAADPIDLATLLDTGIDTYDFTLRRSEPDQTYDIRVTGADVLTGETTMIDGYTLDLVQTRFEIINESGAVDYRSEGTQFFARALGHFFLGAETSWSADGRATEHDNSPVDFIQPGEPGFGTTTPLYECLPADAALLAPRALAPEHLSAKETDDDHI